MKKMILFATTYPYTAGVLAIVWVGSASLVKINPDLTLGTILLVNSITTCIVAAIGFKK